jgi:hypothetical protein
MIWYNIIFFKRYIHDIISLFWLWYWYDIISQKKWYWRPLACTLVRKPCACRSALQQYYKLNNRPSRRPAELQASETAFNKALRFCALACVQIYTWTRVRTEVMFSLVFTTCQKIKILGGTPLSSDPPRRGRDLYLSYKSAYFWCFVLLLKMCFAQSAAWLEQSVRSKRRARDMRYVNINIFSLCRGRARGNSAKSTQNKLIAEGLLPRTKVLLLLLLVEAEGRNLEVNNWKVHAIMVVL